MTLTTMTSSTLFLPHEEETDRPALGYVRGSRSALMIDAGNSAAHAQQFLTALDEQGLPHPRYTAITHWHWDHCYGLHALDTVSVCGIETNEMLRAMADWQWTDEAMRQRLASGEDIEFCDHCIRLEYPDRSAIRVQTADIVFDSFLSIDLGGIECRLLWLENSHADDHTVVFVPQEKVLFVGDILGPDLHHGEMKYYERKLRSLISALDSLDFEMALTGHNGVWSKAEVLDDLREELKLLMNK